ncbi:ataxin-2-like isoform X2 [Mytilus californianus]|uniref:ataxin-2-like isoform X2 n=1 Tax=Mytilus californianus TaxID=6549 RepID=UPI002246267D|nr:ataxin-2-like isoform X2 [Mytilus californianus]
MMNSQKRNRTHRPNTNTGNRVTKARGSFDKNVISEGIFTNPRFTYIATSLVGCCVQLQVKNGKCYEGILKTCSPKMDVVLEMAHKVDDTGNNNIPSRELVQEKIIFNCGDILMITAVDVDLDYAVKDTFTDTAITKQNGVADKELRELTPWEPEESETQGGGGLHDGGASNGWDADDMFSTNERQFNVKSTYDDSLHQYTVPLEKRDTKEYREKEERAALLAQEIEKSDGYRQRTDLENNGEGDNEESKFSAVVRPDNAGPNPGKYVPPGKRNQYNQQRNLRHGAPPNRLPVHQPPPQPTAPRLAAQHSREDYKVNGNDVKEEVKVEEKDNTSPVPDSAGPTESIHTSPVSKIDKKNSTPKAQNALIQDLKDFSVNFKLSEDSKETKKSPEKVEKTEQKEELEEKTKSPPPPVPTTSAALPVVVPATTLDPPQSKEEPKPETNDILKNSSLNPHAKSFVLNPNAKSFQPKQYPQQVPTPPRPQTQSPIIQPMPPAMAPMFQPVIFQTQLGQQMQQQQRPQPKRAVVSIHPPRTDFTAAAAQAATGAPLLAHTNYSAVQYTPFMMPQPASYQVGQVMPMPSATPAAGPRMMTPPSGATMDMSQQPSGHTMFTVGQHGPMPAHIQHQPYHNPQPAHIGPHPGQQNQQNHPAPSPVQHVVTSSQSHPPTSTPQPHNPYQQMSIQGHPPLQPSPHNPASPQTVHMPAVQYQFPLQMQGANNQVMSQTHPPTSVPHSIHSHMQPQFVMMPHPHNQHNQQNQQFQPHHIGHGQTSMVHQAGVPTLQNTQPGTHPQFIPQVPPTQGAPPSIQNFQPNH